MWKLSSNLQLSLISDLLVPVQMNKKKYFIKFFRAANSLTDVMQMIMFNMTFTCVIAIAFNLYVFELNDSISFEMMVAFVDIGMVLMLTFAHYFLAEWITTDLLSIGDFFYNSPWYRLKSNQQRLLAIPIQRAHQEIRLKGLDIFECSLPIFGSVKLVSKDLKAF